MTKKSSPPAKEITRASVTEQAKVRAMEGGAVAGAVVGATAGAFAGPLGALAGGVIGVAAGVVAGAVVSDDTDREEQRTSVVDREIGVIDGTIGEPSLRHPPDSAVAYFAEKEKTAESKADDGADTKS